MTRCPDDETLDKMESLLNIASDFTRLKILYSIIDEEKSVSEIVDEVGASQSLVSHQLKVLKDANLVSFRKEATKVFYKVADHHIPLLLDVVYQHASE